MLKLIISVVVMTTFQSQGDRTFKLLLHGLVDWERCSTFLASKISRPHTPWHLSVRSHEAVSVHRDNEHKRWMLQNTHGTAVKLFKRMTNSRITDLENVLTLKVQFQNVLQTKFRMV